VGIGPDFAATGVGNLTHREGDLRADEHGESALGSACVYRKRHPGDDFGFDPENSLFLNQNSLFRRNNSLFS
ncbi:MAG: hypothetical protein WCF55_13785, partial [Pseudolabrys sp.]